MRKTLLAFALLIFSAASSMAQCSALYGDSSYTLIVVCTPSGVASYAITIAPVTNNTFTITGLLNESQGIVTATCSGSTFNFPMTALPSGNSVVGSGTWTGTGTINIAIGVYNTSMTQTDTCVGTFNVPVFLADPMPGLRATISPTPTQHDAVLRIDGLTEGDTWSYTLLDIQGRAVLQGASEASSVELPIAALPAGMYHAIVITPQSTLTQRLLKH